jgi:lipopolysaccharide cholinephosphotransferase
MNRLQKEILAIYKEFKRICDKHGLQYRAAGGTKVGLSLCEGFIKWDDDMDLAMPLPDYERFIQVAEKELPPGIELIDGMKNAHSDFLFLKLHNINTMFTLFEGLAYPDTYTGVFIDIIPEIGLPTARKKRDAFNKKLDLLMDKSYNMRVLGLAGGGYTVTGVLSQISELAHQYPVYSSKYMREIGGSTVYAVNTVWRTDGFMEYVEKRFEDSVMPLPIGYVDQLITQYGHPPTLNIPESEKNAHHTEHALVDFDHPITYYKDLFTKKEFKPLFAHIKWLQDQELSLKKNVEDAEARETAAARELLRKDSVITDKEQEINHMRQSLSWRLTKPLRAKNAVKRLLRRG